jgi:hypothetical protein
MSFESIILECTLHYIDLCLPSKVLILGLTDVVPVPVVLNPLAVLFIGTPIFSVPDVLYIVSSKRLLKKSFFLNRSVRVWLQSLQKVINTCMSKKCFPKRIQLGVPKKQNLMLILNPLKKLDGD